MWGISYWAIPLFSSLVWLAMLLAMILRWVTQGKPHYEWMPPEQHIAYISDVGAGHFKPLFIAMGAVAVVTFDLGFIAERWLRHKGRLHKNTSTFQKVLSVATIITAIIGAAGLILLTIFDTRRHPNLHDAFLAVFIVGYVVSAILVCWEYQRLGIHIRQARVLRISFWIKLAFILVEVALAIAFGVTRHYDKVNTAAILEWIVALVFTFYILSFFVDFIPAVHTKHHQSRETAEMAAVNNAEGGMPMADDSGADRYGGAVNGYGQALNGNGHTHTNGNGYPNGHTNGYTNGHTNGYTNGHGTMNGQPKPIIPPSRNF